MNKIFCAFVLILGLPTFAATRLPITYDQLDQQQKAQYQASLQPHVAEYDATRALCFNNYMMHLYTKRHGGVIGQPVFQTVSGYRGMESTLDFTTRDQFACKLSGSGLFTVRCINIRTGEHDNMMIPSDYLAKHVNEFKHCGGN